MNLNHLRVFAGVASAGNLTRAAQALRVSQPAVSKQLAELEADLGIPLFDRLPRGVRLTAAGEALRVHAERILNAEQAAEHELRDLAGLGRGRLSIGASTTIGSYLVPTLFGELHRQHPAVELDLQIANTAAIQAAVLDNVLDLGLTEGLVATDALEIESVASDEMVAIAPPGHPLLARAPLQARELTTLPLLMRERGSGTREVVEAALRERGVRAEPVMSLGGTEALKNAVLHGLGIAIVSRLTVDHELRSGQLAELRIDDLQIQRDLHLVRLKSKQPSPAAAAFISLLRGRKRKTTGRGRGGSYAI
jgi:DNA-binding transcriptional LysR family regulator